MLIMYAVMFYCSGMKLNKYSCLVFFFFNLPSVVIDTI